MKNESLYQKTVDILLDAYNDGTLASGNCYACAVGNIVAANCGIKMKRDSLGWPYWEGHPPYNTEEKGRNIAVYAEVRKMWIAVRKGIDEVDEHQIQHNISAMKEIESTGYTPKEIFKLEGAFEFPKRDRWNEDVTMLQRLSSVIKELGVIHETKEEDTQVNINKFEKISKKQLQTV